jgi:hypothetical protein
MPARGEVSTVDDNDRPRADPQERLSCANSADVVSFAALPHSVGTVVVDGRILKRGGKLVAIDTPKVIAEARSALVGVRERTKWR